MDSIIFLINGKEHEVTTDISPDTTLTNYIRNIAKLKGTKWMCLEGGCGACIVSVNAVHPVTGKERIFAVNSCLVAVFSCHGWSITTIEGLGSRRDGFHDLQRRLAGFSGTQCGFCSPGWIMNMHSIYEGNKRNIDSKEVENSFGGNICRCTGYRPILDAFKSFAYDCDKSISGRLQDIEDLSGIKMCREMKNLDFGTCRASSKTIKLRLNGTTWYRVDTVDEVFKIWDIVGADSCLLVAGNTARGVYPMTQSHDVTIDISTIKLLKEYLFEKETLTIGGGMTLNDAMVLFKKIASEKDGFMYLEQFYEHFDLIATVPVRNIGTIAGNLYIKNKYKDFPSDIFILFEAVAADVTLLEKNGLNTQIKLSEFLKTDLNGKIILNIRLLAMSKNYILKSYKIMPRAQNAHALVNAVFNIKFNNIATKSMVEDASIVIGCINKDFVHAKETEGFIIGKNLFDPVIFKAAMRILNGEINPKAAPPEPSPEFRKKLVLGLFFKYIRNLIDCGGDDYKRPISSGIQNYDTNAALFPLNKPIPKLEALVQCSGEAEYTNDIPEVHSEVYVSFVLSSVFRGTIAEFDTSDALNQKGVISFITAKDIPGDNSFTPIGLSFLTEKEKILADEKVEYFGQPIGIIVADNELLASRAAKLVKVCYIDLPKTPPVLTVQNALLAPAKDNRVVNNGNYEAVDRGDDIVKVVKGTYEVFGQYHYMMETQTCLCIPTEDGMDVYSATQSMDGTQIAIAECLDIPLSQVHVTVRRLGGGFGAKISRSPQIACACALACHRLNRPARFVLPMSDNMVAIGKRNPCTFFYEVGVNASGVIQYLKNNIYEDNGISHNETISTLTAEASFSGYDKSRWNVSANSILTDTAANTWCRAPGSVEGIAAIENMMEHIATEMNLDPLSVRLANLDKEDNNLSEMISQMIKENEYYERLDAIVNFNKRHRWKKRGISLVPMKYPVDFWGHFPAFVSVYHRDGTVTLSHGGIEMGQGLNTKVAQVCAHTLGIPLNYIVVKPSNTHTAPNSEATGGSITSESCAYAAKKACETLLTRLEPIKKNMNEPSWRELIAKAYKENVTLSVTHTFTAKDEPVPYAVHSALITEVEVDVLTGLHQILRVDAVEDIGQSVSPEVDVGQIEGALIMAFGYWTSEQLIYDKITGELLTNRTWNYKPPGVKDIPIDFRIQFRRNSENNFGVLRSKATGEPPMCMAVGITHAIRQAVTSARGDSGFNNRDWYEIKLPYTSENILMAIETNLEDMTIQ